MIRRGDKVVVRKSGLRGIVRYVGETEFKSGIWVGIELERQQGKNDGSVNNVRYFECRPDFGLFVRERSVDVLARGAAVSTTKATFEGRGKLFSFSPESRSWISLGDGRVSVSSDILSVRRDFSKSLLIEHNINDITKIEPSMGSQGKAWVFNVIDDESREDEIVYALRFETVREASSFRSSLDPTSSPPSPPAVVSEEEEEEEKGTPHDRLRRLTMNTPSPSSKSTPTMTSPSRRLTIDTPKLSSKIVVEKITSNNSSSSSVRGRGSSLLVPESPLVPPGVDLIQEVKRSSVKKRSSVVPKEHSALTRKGYSPDPSHKPYNQDAMVIERDDVSGAFLFCVFDGHGEFGHCVSKYFESRIAEEIFNHADFPLKIDIAMVESVLRLERMMLRQGTFDCSLSGK